MQSVMLLNTTAFQNGFSVLGHLYQIAGWSSLNREVYSLDYRKYFAYRKEHRRQNQMSLRLKVSHLPRFTCAISQEREYREVSVKHMCTRVHEDIRDTTYSSADSPNKLNLKSSCLVFLYTVKKLVEDVVPLEKINGLHVHCSK